MEIEGKGFFKTKYIDFNQFLVWFNHYCKDSNHCLLWCTDFHY